MKKGFTLAETLVSMAVMGLIVAITLPMIYRTRPNNEMVMFQKAYYLTNRVVSEMINDETLYPDKEDDLLSGFANTDPAVFRGAEYEGERKFCEIFALKLNTDCDVNGNMTTSDGMYWTLPIGFFDEGSHVIRVDVNGRTDHPCEEQTRNEFFDDNDNSCTRPDRFVIIVNRNGRLSLPGGVVSSQYLSEKDKTRQYNEFQ